jgi:hypothetical protein
LILVSRLLGNSFSTIWINKNEYVSELTPAAELNPWLRATATDPDLGVRRA